MEGGDELHEAGQLQGEGSVMGIPICWHGGGGWDGRLFGSGDCELAPNRLQGDLVQVRVEAEEVFKPLRDSRMLKFPFELRDFAHEVKQPGR